MRNFFIALVITVFSATCIIFPPYALYKEYSKYKDYTENGYKVSGTVTKTVNEGKSTGVYLAYKDKDGKDHTGKINETGQVYYKSGETITVYLLEGKEDKPWKKEELEDKIFFIVIAGLLFIAGWIMPVAIIFGLGDKKLLDANGKDSVATILSNELTDDKYYSGIIEFETDRGTRRVQTIFLNKWQRPGDTMNIQYAFDKKGKLKWREK